MRCANEKPPRAQKQNAWQERTFRSEHAQQSRAHRLDRADEARAAHSSPRAQEYAQNARGHRGHDSSQALGQVISPTVSPRASIFELWSQKARVGALERKNFFQSKSQRPFCVNLTYQTHLWTPYHGTVNTTIDECTPSPAAACHAREPRRQRRAAASRTR